MLGTCNGTVFSIARLLGGGESMPKPRYQLPSIFQTKQGSYFIRPWVDVLTKEGLKRIKKTITLGPPQMGKRKAIAVRNQVMEKLNRSDYVIQSQILVSDFLIHYKNTHFETLAASTRAKYRIHLKNHIEPAFEHLMLCEVSTRLVQDWLQKKEDDGLSWATRTDLRNILSSIFTKAADWGHWSEPNPIERVNVGRRRAVREKRKLTDDQTRRLLAALPFEVRIMCCTALFCTLRISEILGIQEKHLNFEAGAIQIRQRYYRGDLDVPKSEKAMRDVPMVHLAGELKRLCLGDPERFVFKIKTRPQWGRALSTTRDGCDILQYFVRPAAKALGFHWPGFGFHALRREAVTAMGASLGISQAMTLAGHSSVDQNLLYTLEDKIAQDRAIRDHQERILGKPEGSIH
jgi:integrase